MKRNAPIFWFSIIEVLVWIFVFSLGLVAILMLLSSSMTLNELNRNRIIASNLAREQIELLRNIRDNNYAKLQPWNLKNPSGTDYTSVFSSGAYYTLESDFSASWDFPIRVQEITDFVEWPEYVSSRMESYRLCLDDENVYTYSCDTNTKTMFFRYMHLEPLEYMSGSVVETFPSSFRVTSKVIWYKNGYHEFDIKTILADWRRI